MVTRNKLESAVDVRAKWLRSMILYEKKGNFFYQIFTTSPIRAYVHVAFATVSETKQLSLKLFSLPWKAIGKLLKMCWVRHTPPACLYSLSHTLKSPRSQICFSRLVPAAEKFVLLSVKWCLHTARYNKAASTQAAPNTFFFFPGPAFWISLQLYKTCDRWRDSKWMFANLSAWSIWTVWTIHCVGVTSPQLSHVSASLPRPLSQMPPASCHQSFQESICVRCHLLVTKLKRNRVIVRMPTISR